MVAPTVLEEHRWLASMTWQQRTLSLLLRRMAGTQNTLLLVLVRNSHGSAQRVINGQLAVIQGLLKTVVVLSVRIKKQSLE